jgi:hypothetical protein
MADEVIIAPEAEPKAPEPVAETPKEESQPTISELVEKSEPVEKPRVVDEHVFVAEKKARKAAERELKALKESIESGASKKEISEDIEEIAEKFDVDKEFLQDFATTVEQKLDAKYASKLGAKEKEEKYDTAFKKALDVALERGPEFADIVNPEIIKSLSLLPKNANKTVSQLLEETYGNALSGKRTIETTKPNGGRDPEPLDYDKARRDGEYFKEVMNDPVKKAEYNKLMLQRGL